MRSLQIYEKVGFQKCERVDEELVHREPLMNPAGNVTKDFLSNSSKKSFAGNQVVFGQNVFLPFTAPPSPNKVDAVLM